MGLNGSKGKNHPDLQGFSGKTSILFAIGAKFTYFEFYILRGKLLNGNMLLGIFEFTNGFKYEGGFMHRRFFVQGSLRFSDGKIISVV